MLAIFQERATNNRKKKNIYNILRDFTQLLHAINRMYTRINTCIKIFLQQTFIDLTLKYEILKSIFRINVLKL